MVVVSQSTGADRVLSVAPSGGSIALRAAPTIPRGSWVGCCPPAKPSRAYRLAVITWRWPASVPFHCVGSSLGPLVVCCLWDVTPLIC